MLRWRSLAPSLRRKAQSWGVPLGGVPSGDMQSATKAPSSQAIRIAGRDVLDGVGGVVYTG